MIRSIRKVEVAEVSPIQPFLPDKVDDQPDKPGVYLILFKDGNEDPVTFLDRSYCYIGCSTVSVRRRLNDHHRYHMRHPEETCGRPPEEHDFQVLICKDGSDAARLEALFQLWHGNHDGEGKRPLEVRGELKAEMEPDFFSNELLGVLRQSKA